MARPAAARDEGLGAATAVVAGMAGKARAAAVTAVAASMSVRVDLDMGFLLQCGTCR
jgi:hypothetical protein